MFVSLEAIFSGTPLGELDFDDSTTFQEVLGHCQKQVQSELTKQIKLFLGHGGSEILNMSDVKKACQLDKPIVVYNELYDIPKYKKMLQDNPECIIDAAERNMLEDVKILLLAGADSNFVNNSGNTSLGWASYNGHDQVVELLLKNNGDPNLANNYDETPLYWASRNGYDKVVALLLKHNADPNLANNNGETPLHWASRNGHDKVFELLLKHKADPNLANKYGNPSLIWASYYGHTKVVALLLENNADPNIADKDGDTPLYWASQKGHNKVVKLLESYIKK